MNVVSQLAPQLPGCRGQLSVRYARLHAFSRAERRPFDPERYKFPGSSGRRQWRGRTPVGDVHPTPPHRRPVPARWDVRGTGQYARSIEWSPAGWHLQALVAEAVMTPSELWEWAEYF